MGPWRVEGSGIIIDSERCLPVEKTYLLWPCHIYRLFHATLEGRKKRFAISIGMGVAEYVVGLVLAICAGFVPTYVSTPAVYLLCVSFGVFMGWAESLTLHVPVQLRKARLVFSVTDDEYRDEMTLTCLRATDRRVTIPLTLLLILLAAGAVADYYLVREPVVTPIVATFVVPSFPAAWHQGAALPIKMLIVDMYAALGLLFIVPVLWAGIVVVASAFSLARRWQVVPIPTYVVTALRPLSEYVLAASAYFAAAVFVLVALYAPRADRIFLGGILFLSLVGALGVFIPFLGLRALLEKAQAQISTDVAVSYYQDVWPVGNGTIRAPDNPLRAQLGTRFTHLLKLEDLMHQSTRLSGIVQQVSYLATGIFIQLAPTIVAVIYVAVTAHNQIQGIFTH